MLIGKNGRPIKCKQCFKFYWCLLSFHQSFDCLGPFVDAEDNLRKFREWYGSSYHCGTKSVDQKSDIGKRTKRGE